MPNLSSQAPAEPDLAAAPRPVEPVDPRSLRRALVIRPRFLGDVCLTLPVIDHLRRHAPGLEIDYLTEEAYAPLLEGDPRLSRVIRARRGGGPARAAVLLSRLARGGYDLAIDLFCNPRTALWTAATAARLRVGYAGKGWRSAAYNRFAHASGKSAVAFHLASISALGWEVDPEAVPALALGISDRKAAGARLATLGIPADDAVPLVAIHPGARWPTRQWSPERYAELIRLLLEREAAARALVLAGPGEAALAHSIVERTSAGPRAVAFSPRDARELAAIVSVCRAFVGPDSGPIHVSVAAGTPTVGIFGRNEPERFFPYPPSLGHRAVYAGVWCSPCHLDECAHTSCLRAVTAEWVWDALAEVLARRAPVSAPVTA